jgi:hypothetical protein
MNHPMEIEDLSLLVRALHRDVSELDARLHRVEALVHELRDSQAHSKETLGLQMIQTP